MSMIYGKIHHFFGSVCTYIA